MKTLIGNFELASRGVYTAVGEATSMPASHLAHPQPTRRLRMTNLSQVEVTVDLTAALAALPVTGIGSYRYILPLYASVTQSATQEIWVGATAGSVTSIPTAAVHLGPIPFWRSLDNDLGRFPRRHSWIDLGSQRTEPWIRYRIVDPGNTTGYVDLGLLIPTPGYVPGHPIAERPSSGIQQEVRQFEAISGATRRQSRPKRRVRDLTLQTSPGTTSATPASDVVAEAEEQWLALIETVGVDKPVVVVKNLEAPIRTMNEVVYGTLFGEPEKVVLPAPWNHAQFNLAILEML